MSAPLLPEDSSEPSLPPPSLTPATASGADGHASQWAARSAASITTRLGFFSLKLFSDVVELRSIGRAADRNHLAASAASKRISDMEDLFGTQLLYRMARGVEPTPAGYALYHHANSALKSLQQLSADLSEFARGMRGHVRTFANLTAVVQFLPSDLASFRRTHTDVRIDIEEQSTSAILDAVSSGMADIGIVAPVQPYPSALQFWHYRDVRLVLVVPPDHPLLTHQSVRFDQAVLFDFVGLAAGGGWDRLMTRSAGDYGLALRTGVRVRSYDAVSHMVSAGLGVSVLPAETADVYAQSLGLRIIKLDEPWADLPLHVCVRDYRALSAPARVFLHHLLDQKPAP